MKGEIGFRLQPTCPAAVAAAAAVLFSLGASDLLPEELEADESVHCFRNYRRASAIRPAAP